MSKIDDGGPAFARAGGNIQGDQWCAPQDGMSLRDFFAAAALTGLLVDTGSYKIAAQEAYRFADAMLRARHRITIDN